MGINIAINGFGRIGRLAFRQLFEADGFTIAAINDLTSPQMLAHLLKYDTSQGRYDKKIGYGENSLTVDGIQIPILAERNPGQLPGKSCKSILFWSAPAFSHPKKRRWRILRPAQRKCSFPLRPGRMCPPLFMASISRL